MMDKDFEMQGEKPGLIVVQRDAQETYTLTLSEISEMVTFLTNRPVNEVEILLWLANRK